MTIPEPVLSDLILSLHHKLIFSVVAVVKQLETAEDIAMISWQITWERREDFQTIEQFRAFLFIAAKNLAITHVKGQKIRRSIEQRIEITDIDNSTERKIDTTHTIDAFRYAIYARFGNKYSTVLNDQLADIPAIETANKLNVTASTVTSMRNIIKNFLRHRMRRPN